MSDKRILLTGASKGIGYQIAKSLVAMGHQLMAIARSEKKLLQLKEFAPDQIEILALDITTDDSADTLKNYFIEHDLKLDALIHNAGLLINKPFMDQTDSDWRKQMEVNLFAPVTITRTLLPFFNEGSHILSISSMGGYQGSSKFPGLSAYSVSKGALSILSEVLAAELSDQKIKSNALCLGAVQTEMLVQAFPGFEAPLSPKEMGDYIANFAVDGHRFYNGQILPVTLGNPG